MDGWTVTDWLIMGHRGVRAHLQKVSEGEKGGRSCRSEKPPKQARSLLGTKHALGLSTCLNT